MDVTVHYGLPGRGADVDPYVEAMDRCVSLCCGTLLSAEELRHGIDLRLSELEVIRRMAPRNHQDMPWSHGELVSPDEG